MPMIEPLDNSNLTLTAELKSMLETLLTLQEAFVWLKAHTAKPPTSVDTLKSAAQRGTLGAMQKGGIWFTTQPLLKEYSNRNSRYSQPRTEMAVRWWLERWLAKGSSINQLANATGIAHTTLDKWLAGKGKPDVVTLKKLAAFLKIDVIKIVEYHATQEGFARLELARLKAIEPSTPRQYVRYELLKMIVAGKSELEIARAIGDGGLLEMPTIFRLVKDKYRPGLQRRVATRLEKVGIVVPDALWQRSGAKP